MASKAKVAAKTKAPGRTTVKRASVKTVGRTKASPPSAAVAKKPRIFGMSFASVYPLYVQKVDPLMRKIRYLDKLIDEIARGKKMADVLRE
jgi:hypothetical protein